MSNVSSLNVVSYLNDLRINFAERVRYQLEDKHCEIDSSIVLKIKSFAKDFEHDKLVRHMIDANVSSNFMNAHLVSSSRFNEKAIVKVDNINRALECIEMINIYTKAILLSVAAFETAETMLEQSETIACCSSNAKLADSKRNKLLVRTHNIYSASTQSAQYSTSNNALLAYNVIREKRNASNKVCYVLNHDNATTARLLALCA